MMKKILTIMAIAFFGCAECPKEEVCLKLYFVDGHTKNVCYDLSVGATFSVWEDEIMYIDCGEHWQLLRRGKFTDFDVVSRKPIGK